VNSGAGVIIMAKKEMTAQFKLQAPGGTATPAPPIGPALGAHGVNPGQFIQRFNAMSAHLKGKVIGVLVTVYKDRTFDIELKSPPASVMLKDIIKVEKGSGEPNKNKIGKVTMAQCRKIAEEKGKDLNAFDLDHGAKVIAGTARSMGITVEG
jgi:large subunit ribosomal protein L11